MVMYPSVATSERPWWPPRPAEMSEPAPAARTSPPTATVPAAPSPAALMKLPPRADPAVLVSALASPDRQSPIHWSNHPRHLVGTEVPWRRCAGRDNGPRAGCGRRCPRSVRSSHRPRTGSRSGPRSSAHAVVDRERRGTERRDRQVVVARETHGRVLAGDRHRGHLRVEPRSAHGQLVDQRGQEQRVAAEVPLTAGHRGRNVDDRMLPLVRSEYTGVSESDEAAFATSKSK